MSDNKGPVLETLRTKGEPRDILVRIRPAFREHTRPLTREEGGESLGGGSIPNARWDHRLSRDLDIHVQYLEPWARGWRPAPSGEVTWCPA